LDCENTKNAATTTKNVEMKSGLGFPVLGLGFPDLGL